jgi:hypothetical protein
MGFARKVLMQALFTRLTSRVTGLGWSGRRYVEPDDLGVERMPALCLVVDSNVPDRSPGRPPVWTLNAVAYLYAVAPPVEAGDASQSSDALDDLVDQVEAALVRAENEPMPNLQNPQTTTLGGLCHRCEVAGPVDFFYYMGATGVYTVAVVPIEVVAVATPNDRSRP